MTAPPDTVTRLIAWGAGRLCGSDSPRLDAEVLLAHALRRDRSWLLAHPEDRPGSVEKADYASRIGRRARGEPVAYLIGRREFWSLDLEVTTDTLIPRPDTETLVEAALERLAQPGRARVLDLGTGSGAIALAIASSRPTAVVIGVDASANALAVAQRNRERLGIDNARFVRGDWYRGIPERPLFDMIVANPPYVRDDDPHLGRGDVRFEPRAALAAGADGLADLRVVIAGAPAQLRPGGYLLVEHGADQAVAVAALFEQAGFEEAESVRDLAGQTRVFVGRC